MFPAIWAVRSLFTASMYAYVDLEDPALLKFIPKYVRALRSGSICWAGMTVMAGHVTFHSPPHTSEPSCFVPGLLKRLCTYCASHCILRQRHSILACGMSVTAIVATHRYLWAGMSLWMRL
jgi:hypothetical protein